MTFDLNFASLCADFEEDIKFQFSLELASLMNRFLGPAKARQALSLLNQNVKVPAVLIAQMKWNILKVYKLAIYHEFLSKCRERQMLWSNASNLALKLSEMMCGFAQATSSSAPMGTQARVELAISMATGLVSLPSRASMSMLVIAGEVRIRI